jgi:hypothetical protein
VANPELAVVVSSVIPLLEPEIAILVNVLLVLPPVVFMTVDVLLPTDVVTVVKFPTANLRGAATEIVTVRVRVSPRPSVAVIICVYVPLGTVDETFVKTEFVVAVSIVIPEFAGETT